ncbi:MAG: hypothetical protein ACO22Y_00030 [Sediminibacterium sp.]
MLREANVTNVGGSTFTTGTGDAYATRFAFSSNKKDNKATKYAQKLGYKKVSRPSRPSNTKLIDYLDENITGEV